MTDQQNEAEREAFEKWYRVHTEKPQSYIFCICDDGTYRDNLVQKRYETWQAARADLIASMKPVAWLSNSALPEDVFVSLRREIADAHSDIDAGQPIPVAIIPKE
jgi:hypothetical protein